MSKLCHSADERKIPAVLTWPHTPPFPTADARALLRAHRQRLQVRLADGLTETAIDTKAHLKFARALEHHLDQLEQRLRGAA